MSMYIIRLDDASDYMDLRRWNQMEKLLDKYDIKPIFGIIPKNKDESLITKYKRNPDFWNQIYLWISKGWIPAMHGYEHRYVSREGGVNPVNKQSEFAGLLYEEQAEKIRKGWSILDEHDIVPDIFFAPSHTFDKNTLKAIKNETSIRFISDTIAWDIYKEGDFCFIPQQSGNVRKLPFKTVTFCYHPNTMDDNSYKKLDQFIAKNIEAFINFSYERILEANGEERKLNIFDCLLRSLYFMRR